MGRPLAFQVDGEWTIFELTFRCMQGRFLMRPETECTKRILGVLWRSLLLYGDNVKLLAGGGTSNHLHLIVATFTSMARARFKSHLKTNISKELGDLFDWKEHLFGRRTRDIPILDEAALMNRVHYCLRHGHKEGLVDERDPWPGVPWLDALVFGKPLEGVWYDRTAFYHARREWELASKERRGPKPTLEQFATVVEVPLEPLPCMAGLTPEQQRERWQAILIEAQAKYPAPEGEALGTEALRTQDPHTRPKRSKHSPAPACHASTKQAAKQWKEVYGQFVTSYRLAWQRLRGELQKPFSSFGFPSGGVPPTWPDHYTSSLMKQCQGSVS
jgi:hypothetical protein